MRRIVCSRLLRAAAVPAIMFALIPATPDRAVANPPGPGFLDLSGYPPVDAREYMQNLPYMAGFEFATPAGWLCSHNQMNSLGEPSRMTLTCEGPRPDKGPGTWQVRVATDAPATIEPSYPPLVPSTTAKLLPAMHRITVRDIECAADDTGITACRVGIHGFILKPASTELF